MPKIPKILVFQIKIHRSYDKQVYFFGNLKIWDLNSVFNVVSKLDAQKIKVKSEYFLPFATQIYIETCDI